MIYAYSTPEIKRHNGHLKIGQAVTQSVEERIRQQGQTVDVKQVLEWKEEAVFKDGSGEVFTDNDFRAFLYKLGYERIDRTEYVKISVPDSQERLDQFRESHGVVKDGEYIPVPYDLRDEQKDAVKKTLDYSRSHSGGSFLWNAKPRFGKTLAVYDLVLHRNAKKVLVVTNRPAIANSWYSDYEKFIGRQKGYFFVSGAESIAGKPLVLSHEDYVREMKSRARKPGVNRSMGLIEFVSLQDLKGSASFGGEFRKLEHIASTHWDLLVIDEAHEGVDTYRADAAFDRIDRDFTLHLSGTPFKALANEKFPESAIFNWTYADEQAAKRRWSGEGNNPYEALPKLNMYTYRMSDIVAEELSGGVEIDGEERAFAFDLNEFFATNGRGSFIHDSAVDSFLDALTTHEKFPFSTQELRDEIRHSFWLLNRVDSAKALKKKLSEHPVFRDYKVVLAAGDGRLDDDQTENARSFDEVTKAISEHEHTITLSVGQLTTGVTVPEWTAVLMLSSIRSPALYMQAAFRAQNPCLFRRGEEIFRKENAYVFDFDPARTLAIYDTFANDLMPRAAAGDTEARRRNIRELLNFFPVIAEDEGGAMTELDAEKVLSIPRRIKSREVVNSGFMSNYLFTDAIGVVFRAPQELLDIITKFTPVSEPKTRHAFTTETAKELDIDENGNVEVPEEKVIGLHKDIFGEKIYGDPLVLDPVVPPTGRETTPDSRKEMRDKMVEAAVDRYVKPAIEKVSERYGTFRASDRQRVERQLKGKAESIVVSREAEYHIETDRLERERDEKLEKTTDERERLRVREDCEQKKEAARESFLRETEQAFSDFGQTAELEAVREADTAAKAAVKREREAEMRDHLRGFSRTIPSFLMAYGDENVRLENFDGAIPEDVFREVTGITPEQFRKLRDGGEFIGDDGTARAYPGLFDETVFNDSVREFLRKKEELADYFDESHEEDIFDYIPPQKTNQIFTPRKVVKKMLDDLEEANPGCFDDTKATFADLYMKSGLYIAEIVKRLYRSAAIREAYPDDGERIRHILREQVFGLAPTEIIRRIATNYILGFDAKLKEETKNFALGDAAEAAKRGALAELVDKCFQRE